MYALAKDVIGRFYRGLFLFFAQMRTAQILVFQSLHLSCRKIFRYVHGIQTKHLSVFYSCSCLLFHRAVLGSYLWFRGSICRCPTELCVPQAYHPTPNVTSSVTPPVEIGLIRLLCG